MRYRVGVLGNEINNSTTFTPMFMMGLSAGTASLRTQNPTGSSTTFLGYKWAPGITWIYYNGSGTPTWVQKGGSPLRMFRIANGVTASIYPGTVDAVFYASATGSVMGGFAFEIQKDSVTGVQNVYSMSSYNAQGLAMPPAGVENLYDWLDYGWGPQGKGVVSFNESSGSLDTFTLFWSGSSNRSFEIADIVIGRYA